jgi:large subunit ribosomal protein L24
MKSSGRLPKLHIKAGDMVMAISGADADGKKTGKVLKVFRKEQRAVVEGFNQVKKTLRKSQDNPQGGIIDKESPIAISNLRLARETDTKAPKKSESKGGRGRGKGPDASDKKK